MAAKKRKRSASRKKTVTIVIDEATFIRLAQAVEALQALAMGVDQFVQEPLPRRQSGKGATKRRAKRRK